MNGNNHHRRSIRLKKYDYSTPGAYFITICAYEKKSLFGEVADAGDKKPTAMRLNDMGMIIYEEWKNTEKIRKEIQIDEFVIMPNHIHGIVWIIERPEKGKGFKMKACHKGSFREGELHKEGCPTGRIPYARTKEKESDSPGLVSPSGTIGAMVRGFKSAVTRRIRDISGNPEMKIWHRNYWDHVIRDDADMARIREYVHNNPARWELDSLNCHRNTPYGRTPFARTSESRNGFFCGGKTYNLYGLSSFVGAYGNTPDILEHLGKTGECNSPVRVGRR